MVCLHLNLRYNIWHIHKNHSKIRNNQDKKSLSLIRAKNSPTRLLKKTSLARGRTQKI